MQPEPVQIGLAVQIMLEGKMMLVQLLRCHHTNDAFPRTQDVRCTYCPMLHSSMFRSDQGPLCSIAYW